MDWSILECPKSVDLVGRMKLQGQNCTTSSAVYFGICPKKSCSGNCMGIAVTNVIARFADGAFSKCGRKLSVTVGPMCDCERRNSAGMANCRLGNCWRRGGTCWKRRSLRSFRGQRMRALPKISEVLCLIFSWICMVMSYHA